MGNQQNQGAGSGIWQWLGKVLALAGGFFLASMPTALVAVVGRYFSGNVALLVGFALLAFFLLGFILLGKGLGLWTKNGQGSLGEARPLAPSIGIAFAFSMATRIFIVIVSMFMKAESTQNDQAIQTLAARTPIILLVFAIMFVAPVVEEVIFRGMVFKFFFKDRPWGAIILSTVIFAAAHVPTDIPSGLMYGSLGLAFSLTYYTTKRQEMSILCHFLNNFLPGIALLVMYG